jgi:hypothetical protein
MLLVNMDRQSFLKKEKVQCIHVNFKDKINTRIDQDQSTKDPFIILL